MNSENECPQQYCGCNTVSIFMFDILEEINYEELLIHAITIILVTITAVKYSLKWFICKDLYPLKEKSPILCILMIVSMGLQLIMFPVLYSTNYLTNMFLEFSTKFKFRAIQVALDCTVYFIYFIRSLRIYYAHETDTRRKNTFPFKIFKREYLLAIAVLFVALAKYITVLSYSASVNDDDENKGIAYSFAFSYEIASTNTLANSQENSFILHKMIVNFIWQLLLMYGLWLQEKVNHRYSMKTELITLLTLLQVCNATYLFMLIYNLKSYSILSGVCENSGWLNSYIPTTEISRIINLLVCFWLTIIKPLNKTNLYHSPLPTGPYYGFIKTMRYFLFEPQFLKLFNKYLEHLDEQENTGHYTKNLRFWQQIVLLKISERETEASLNENRFQSISSLITEVEEEVFSDHKDLINNIKESIISLEDNDDDGELDSEIYYMRKNKFKQNVNLSLVQLEEIALDKLNKVYRDKYVNTESYFELKQILNRNKKVNLNLIMLDMALIVDSENEFT